MDKGAEMKTVGDPASLKKAVIRHYHSDERKLKKEAGGRIRKIRQWKKAQIAEIKSSRKPRMQSIQETAKRRAINEARLSAQLEYQRKKGAFVDKVVEEARERLKAISTSQNYLNYVKARLPHGDYVAYCSSPKHKTLFGSKMRLDKNITGIKVVAGETTYDFTLDSLMGARLDEVKMAASKELFGE